MAGLAKEADNEYHSLLDLLATLADPSKTLSQAESFTFAEARFKGMVPEASEETLRAFIPSEIKLYKHASSHKLKADELISTIKLIKSVEFNVDDINVDLHKRVAEAIAQGYFTSHNMLESNSDGCNLWRRYSRRCLVANEWLVISISVLRCWRRRTASVNLEHQMMQCYFRLRILGMETSVTLCPPK